MYFTDNEYFGLYVIISLIISLIGINLYRKELKSPCGDIGAAIFLWMICWPMAIFVLPLLLIIVGFNYILKELFAIKIGKFSDLKHYVLGFCTKDADILDNSDNRRYWRCQTEEAESPKIIISILRKEIIELESRLKYTIAALDKADKMIIKMDS